MRIEDNDIATVVAEINSGLGQPAFRSHCLESMFHKMDALRAVGKPFDVRVEIKGNDKVIQLVALKENP